MPTEELFELTDLAAAIERAKTSGKLVIIDFTAEWCGPCRAMERTAWKDERVIGWMREHAHGVRIDIDQQPQISDQFGVRAVPTVLALRDGVELDRFTGARPTAQVLEWAEGLLAGRTEWARLQEAAQGKDLHARFDLARSLSAAGRFAEALPQLAWLWNHSLEHDPAWVGVRLSFLLNEITELVKAYPPARAEFAALRDFAEQAAGASWTVRLDWLALNQALGEPERNLEWFDSIKATLFAKQTAHLDQWLAEPLKKAGRWVDLALLHPDPLEELERTHKRVQEFAPPEAPPGIDSDDFAEMQADLRAYAMAQLRSRAADLVRAHSAAGATAEVERIILRARELDGSEEMASALAAARS